MRRPLISSWNHLREVWDCVFRRGLCELVQLSKVTLKRTRAFIPISGIQQSCLEYSLTAIADMIAPSLSGGWWIGSFSSSQECHQPIWSKMVISRIFTSPIVETKVVRVRSILSAPSRSLICWKGRHKPKVSLQNPCILRSRNLAQRLEYPELVRGQSSQIFRENDIKRGLLSLQ